MTGVQRRLNRKKGRAGLTGRKLGYGQAEDIVGGKGWDNARKVTNCAVTAAMVIVDAVVRLLPGALGSETSALNESFSEGMLDHPQYTRPPDFRGMKVPDVLLGGNHAEIERWRRDAALAKTRRNRPDLLK